MEHPAAEVEHSLTEFVAYCLYPPLYLAGPTATFNAFASQLRAPQRSFGARRWLVRRVEVRRGAVAVGGVDAHAIRQHDVEIPRVESERGAVVGADVRSTRWRRRR